MGSATGGSMRNSKSFEGGVPPSHLSVLKLATLALPT